MELPSIMNKIPDFLKKYKYAALILIIGIALMLIPEAKKVNKEPNLEVQTNTKENSIDDDLCNILSKISGAGRVAVMITEAKGKKVTYQTDTDTSSSDTANNETIKTVTITTSEKNEEGLIIQTEPPIYLGAVVVSEGADKPSVKLAIVEAVSKVTGLGANQITVLKMK